MFLSDIHPFIFVLGLNETEGTNSTTSFRLVAVVLALQRLHLLHIFHSNAYKLVQSGIQVFKPDPGLSGPITIIPGGLNPGSLEVTYIRVLSASNNHYSSQVTF